MSDEPEESPEIDASTLTLTTNWQPGQYSFYGPESRTIPLVGQIDQDIASAFISQLLELDGQCEDVPIIVHLNTEGGSLVDAFAIYDMIKAVKSPVIMVVMGGCMSAGLLILSAADMRFSTPNSLFFYHQVILDGLSVQSAEHIESMASYYAMAQADYDEIVRSRAKISKTVWKKEFAGRTSKFLTATQALQFGIVDEIIKYTKKPKIKLGDE